MIATTQAYMTQLRGLLPQGEAWNTQKDSVLTKTLQIIAEELVKIHGRTGFLIEEADPRAASELLQEWETIAGLPDSCTGPAETLQERRNRLVQKITNTGGQSKAFFIAIAVFLGYAITITEYRPFITGISQTGVGILNGGHAVRYHWTVSVPNPRLTYFRTGVSTTGENLLSVARALDLECILNRLKPAHTNLIFNYEGV